MFDDVKLKFLASFSQMFYKLVGTIYQPLRSGRIWHKVNF